MSHKQRTYLDPIHGPIQLNMSDELEFLLVKLIDTKEFQRLRRIRQMGTGWFTFHGAEHTRFGHSLGSLFIASKMINHLSVDYLKIAEYAPQILVSALLHDVGHGPLSHTAEKLVPIAHEEWTKRIIQETSIAEILKEFDKDLVQDVIKTIEYNSVPLFVSQIVSSYIDCDRLDYLHRDSYYVGVPYGLTGSNRIIASLDIDEKSNKLVVKESIGLDAVIHYLHARYSMYQQIYQHKKNLASDFMLKKIVERVREIEPANIPTSLNKWIHCTKDTFSKLDLNAYFQVDDFMFMTIVSSFANNNSDKILEDLSQRFISRDLFKALEFRHEVSDDKIKEVVKQLKDSALVKGIDANYYLGIERSAAKPYEPYEISSNKTGKSVYIKQKSGAVKELSQISGLVKALSQENIVKTCLIFAPELEDAVKDIKGFQELCK